MKKEPETVRVTAESRAFVKEGHPAVNSLRHHGELMACPEGQPC